MTTNVSIHELVAEARSGNADACKSLAFVFSGFFRLAYPEYMLGYFECEEPGDYRRLIWYTVNKKEVMRTFLASEGMIAVKVCLDLNCNTWGGGAFPSIERMASQMRELAAHADEVLCPEIPRKTPRQRRIRRRHL